jgi:molecular chaperone DnaK
MVFQSEKTLTELGDKIDAADKADVEAAIAKLKETIKSGTTEDIKADTEALEKSFYKISEKLYAQAQQGDPGAQGGAGGEQFYDANYEDNSNNQ